MTLRACTSEDALPCCSNAFSGGSASGKGSHALIDRIRERADTLVREQHALKRVQIVEQSLRRLVLNLRVIQQCAQRLILEREKAPIELISAGGVRAARPGIQAIRTGQLHIRHAGTMRQTSTVVSPDGWLVTGSIKRMFGGNEKTTLTKPFCRRLL